MSLMITDETRWRQSLAAAGKEVVQRYLAERPGGERDPVDEFVYKPPYPTREFCEAWLAEQNDVLFRMSGSGIVALCMLALFAITGGFAACSVVASLNAPNPGASGGGGGGSAAASAGSGSSNTLTSLDTPIGGPTITAPGINNSVGSPTVSTPPIDPNAVGSGPPQSGASLPVAMPIPGTAPIGGNAGAFTIVTPSATTPIATPWPGQISTRPIGTAGAMLNAMPTSSTPAPNAPQSNNFQPTVPQLMAPQMNAPQSGGASSSRH